MPKSKHLRVVCVAIPFSPLTDEIVMVTSRKHPQKWILPKGGWEEKLGESLAEAARREAKEEAGIESLPFPSSPPPEPILTTSDPKSLFHFFPLPVSSLASTFLEDHERKREFVPYDEAERRLLDWDKSSKKGKGEGEGEGRKRKEELVMGLRAWKTWREKGGDR